MYYTSLKYLSTNKNYLLNKQKCLKIKNVECTNTSQQNFSEWVEVCSENNAQLY